MRSKFSADDDKVCDDAGRHPAWAAWAADIERVAARCGANEAQLLYDEGLWYEPLDDEDVPEAYEPPEYAAAHRTLQFQRLDGLGVPPTADEKAALPWPQRQPRAPAGAARRRRARSCRRPTRRWQWRWRRRPARPS